LKAATSTPPSSAQPRRPGDETGSENPELDDIASKPAFPFPRSARGHGQWRGCDGVGEEFDFNGAVSMKAGSSVSHSARAT